MDEDAAKNLIREVLESSFNKEKFIYLIKNIFNHIENAPFVYKGNLIFDDFADSIKTLERIGKYKDPEDKLIDILIVHLKKETTLERARTKQRNFIAKYLKGSRGDILKDAALVAFVSPNNEDWRFSLVKMEYKFNDKGKVKEEFTPARRYSFLVGKNENSHTAQSRLLPLLLNDKNNPTLKELEESFSVERVTKEFFEKYRDLFLRIKESLDAIVKKDAKVRADFKEKNINTVDFTKKLLGQIVFLYFLQKKGWFGVEKDKDWGTGAKNFLRSLFTKKIVDYKNFFNDILEPLFYEALRYDRSYDNHYFSYFKCKIPFLNGGLFDPINDYDWSKTEILLPNELFSNNQKTKEGDAGDGILDVFDRYNFTVKEDEPLEKEVAIDPEMLGKVFENLLEVKDRKSKGTYYTPREIVHYMCQESLINYLYTSVNEELMKKAVRPQKQLKLVGNEEPEQLSLRTKEELISKEDLEIFIKHGELIAENEKVTMVRKEHIKEGKLKRSSYKFKLSGSIRENAKLIDDKLREIKVCDPTVGSGAFLVGMMNEIVKARQVLETYIQAGKTTYDFKRECIEKSLYGVDIDPGAVEIAKLRLWLSLIVDEENIENIKPLPNLDFKIMQGNSLLSEFMGIDFDKESDNKNGQLLISHNDTNVLIEELKRKKKEYLNKASAGGKKDLKQEIEDLIIKIFEGKLKRQKNDYFSQIKTIEEKYKVLLNIEQRESIIKEEKEKLYKASGFNLEQFEKQLREYTTGNKIRPFFPWKLYFAEVFHEKGGFDVVIANPPYVSVKEIIPQDKKTFGQLFETGKGRFNLFTLFLEKGHKLLRPDGVLTYILPESLYFNFEYRFIREYLLNHSSILFVNLFSSRVFEAAVDTSVISFANKQKSNNSFPVIRDLKNSSFKLSQEELNQLPFKIFPVNLTQKSKPIIDKLISNNFDTLEKILEIQQGIIYSGLPKDKVFSNTQVNKTYKKILDGRDVLKWRINWEEKQENRYIHYSDRLHRPREERIFLAKEKILLPRKATRILAAYDNKQYYALNTAYLCLPKSKKYNLKYVLACLNSKLINYFYSSLFFGWQITIPALNLMPIPVQNTSGQKPFIDLVDKILAVTKDDDYLENPAKQAKVREYEKQIDQLVYKLYGLTEEEIKIIENEEKKKK